MSSRRNRRDKTPGLGGDSNRRRESRDSRQTESNRNYRDSRFRRDNNRRTPQGTGQSDESSSQINRYSRTHKENNDRQEKRENRPVRQMGFVTIQKLLENEDLEDIVFQLNNARTGLKECLENNDMKSDIVVLVLKLLGKVCSSNFQNSIITILEMALRSRFADNVVTYISKLSLQNDREKKFNKFFWDEPDNFWENLIVVSRTVNDRIPTSSCAPMLKILMAAKTYIPVIETTQSIHISDDIKAKVANLHEITEKTAKHVERKREHHNRGREFEEVEQEPPDDFREINVYPSANEVTYPDTPYLRANIVDRAYDSINQYLDIQFRLLREDFVRPLRQGICHYLRDPNVRKIDDVKIYKVVRFLCIENVNEQNCFRIQFDFKQKKKQINFEQSRRFMFGSLLCFTSDNFVSILFGKVVDRDIKDLEKSQLIVGFDENVVMPTNLFDLNFLMVESSVFFEPYFHVLNVLKKMEPDHFPMERYIIKVRTDVKPPEYLLNIDPQYYTIEDETFWPLDWDNRKFYNLNESQEKAFEAALTQEFSIIQGPPGTGKTFLGLKIARTLIENGAVWYRSSPILVICFTNHALDQFLEGLLGATERIIRVGGQSKNERLKQFNIKNRRGEYSNQAVGQKRREVRSLLTKIKEINECLRMIEEGKSIMHFDSFYGIIPEYEHSTFCKLGTHDMLDWLFNGIDRRNIRGRMQASDILVSPQNKAMEAEVTENQNEVDIDMEDGEIKLDLDEIFDNIDVQSWQPLINVEMIQKKCGMLQIEIDALPTDDFEANYARRKLNQELFNERIMMDYLQHRLSQYAIDMDVAEPRYVDLQFPNRMDHDSRWQLYFHWLSIFVKDLIKKKEKITKEFRQVYRVYTDLRDMEDVQAMKRCLVVGMTTTGAARLRSSLQSLRSPIVIVEEAAEVLEAHIVTSLTNYCQHLILIGDHQQLKPSTANFKIETQFKLGISLFERMVLNKIQCYMLDVQHRMRPEISKLICPMIYPHLKDHESVLNRPPIKGIEKSVFFIDHQHKEEVCNDNSKKNVHEALFLVELARHLVLNDYKPEDITILAAYLGQMFEIRKEKKRYHNLLQDVRIAVLDNYQGEESNIILLSLVRSNDEQKIGFLKIENRVCVALSRARNGFYVMGNMTQLTHESPMWVQIKETLEKQDAIGSHLTLQCQVHRHKFSAVQTADDFLRFPEGGCDLMCESQLSCGHMCTKLCHANDRDHRLYQCRETCGKNLCEDPTHLCTKYCFKVCGPCYYVVEKKLECGHTAKLECHVEPASFKCTVPVMSKLPCGHEARKPCSADPEKFCCPFPCETRVEPCGHACTLGCHAIKDPDHLEYQCMKPCEKARKGCSMEKEEDRHICTNLCHEDCMDCIEKVKKKRTLCTHTYEIACNLNADDIKCINPCKKSLPCGHNCPKKCFESCGGCKVKVEKVVPDCQHEIKIECCLEPLREHCYSKCNRLLPCGHQCDKQCNEPCTDSCKVLVDCSKQSPCGHIIKQIRCYRRDTVDPDILSTYCKETCNTKLKCEHTCPGSCGTCHQGRMHVRCNQKCGVPLICNHECPIPCRQNCKPCNQKCTYNCGHSNCGKSCGETCTSCREPCLRGCKHQKCRKRCGEICNVPPCTRPCDKKLRKCGHRCVGFCGDPCPILCRICDHDELTETFLGNEDEEDAIYVMLVDCNHIFESTDLDRWMEMDGDEIKAKVCPKCKSTIKKSRRYNEILRSNMKDLANVKLRLYGTEQENRINRENLVRKLLELHRQHITCLPNTKMEHLLRTLQTRLKPVVSNHGTKRRQEINRMDIQAIKAKAEIIEMIIQVFKKHEHAVTKELESFSMVNFILKALMRDNDSITEQEIEDIKMEIQRLTRCVQLEKIQLSSSYIMLSSKTDAKILADKIKEGIDNKNRYDLDRDGVLQSQLEDLKTLVKSSLAITEAEKREIVGALQLRSGHWYKCSNGHPYIITECGGPNQISKCNECGAQIGGTNHQLLPGNSHTGEFDGSRYAAWSEQANLQNYGFRF